MVISQLIIIHFKGSSHSIQLTIILRKFVYKIWIIIFCYNSLGLLMSFFHDFLWLVESMLIASIKHRYWINKSFVKNATLMSWFHFFKNGIFQGLFFMLIDSIKLGKLNKFVTKTQLVMSSTKFLFQILNFLHFLGACSSNQIGQTCKSDE